MIPLRKLFNKISTKVALIIIILIVSMFVLLDIIVVDRGTRTFNDVYQIIRDQGSLPSDDTPFITPSPDPNMPFFQPPAGTEVTPREHFKTKFQASLFILGLAALAGAIGIGFLISRIVARPLNKLSSGMKKLRQNHYQERLEENDSEEFNTLITEFNDLATELQRVEELRKNLISDTSHELRTPLASLTAQLEGLEDGVLELNKERIGMLKEQVTRLSAMTEGLQDYAHLRSQAVKLQKQPVRLKDLASKIILQLKKNLDDNHINVQLTMADDYMITADPALLERILTNLFSNTIRYAQAKQIVITADQSHISFADDGVGIPSEHLHDIFERFFRLEKSRNRATGGMGLGLAIVREIAEAHDWKIYAKTPDNKIGVAFVIDLT